MQSLNLQISRLFRAKSSRSSHRSVKKGVLKNFANFVYRSSRPDMFYKKVLLEISQNSQKTLVFEALSNKVAGLKACNI